MAEEQEYNVVRVGVVCEGVEGGGVMWEEVGAVFQEEGAVGLPLELDLLPLI